MGSIGATVFLFATGISFATAAKKKGSIYEGGLRVPAIIEWPARSLKGRTAVPVSTCDMYPTLMAMAGVKIEAPHPLDGIDVSNIIAGTEQKRSTSWIHGCVRLSEA